MGVSTNANICYGVHIGEDKELLPWVIKGEIESSQYEYWEWWEEHGDGKDMPFEMENCCSGDCPEWIIAMPGTIKTAYRGDPEEISMTDVDSYILNSQAFMRFKKFLKSCGIKQEPKWYLYSYWG